MDRPVDVVIVVHRERHKSMGSDRSRCICLLSEYPNDACARERERERELVFYGVLTANVISARMR